MGLKLEQVIPELIIGYEVKHNKYGTGKILECDNSWIKINFSIKTTKFATESLEEGILTLVNEEEYLSLLKRSMVAVKLKQRKIKYFVHFTPLDNLGSIISKGIMPVSKLEEKHYRYIQNDEKRLDQRRDAISLSVSFPNYRLLYVFMKNQPDLKWAILLLDAEEVIKLNPAYFWDNAAKSEFIGRDWSQFQGASSFEAMFGGNRCSKIPPFYPTNEQAEVMVNSDISPRLISKIVFRDNADAISFCEKYSWITDKVEVNTTYFENRIDWKERICNGK